MNALRRIAVIAVTAPLAVTLLAQGPGAQAPQIGIGEQLGIVGSLRDVRGSQRSLSDFQFKALVLFFAGTECPVSNRSMPGMIDLEAQYRDRAKFVAVYPNEADTFGRIAGHGYDWDVPFLLLKDIGQGLSDRLGIERTGSVAVLDADLVLRYRGGSAGASGADTGGEDFVQALDQLLAGEDILLAETTGEGTSIQRESLDPKLADVTYSRDVAPILQSR